MDIKSRRRFMEKEYWDRNFMCGQAGLDWNGFKSLKE